MNNFSICIPSIPKNIRMIESFIDNAKEKHNLSDSMYGNIMIAVTEAVSNSIKHGNKNDSAKNVILVLFLENNLVKFRIEDEGSGFNHNTQPDPTAPENLLKPHGRGIFLMKNLADEVTFKAGGKIVELTFYMNP